MKLPAPQTLQGVHAARPPVEKLEPSGQTVQELEPAGAADPGPQRPQTASRVAAQAETGAEPAPQAVQAAHE